MKDNEGMRYYERMVTKNRKIRLDIYNKVCCIGVCSKHFGEDFLSASKDSYSKNRNHLKTLHKK